MRTTKENPAPVAAGSGAKTHRHAIFAGNSTDGPAAKLLPRLEGVRETGPGRWTAKCPAHDDRHPSLSVRETRDGTILIKCWAGCGAAEIVAAVGLTLADLFEKPLGSIQPLRPRERWDRGDVWQLLAHESAVAAIAAADAAAGRPVSHEDAERAGLAADRLADAVHALGVSR